MNLIPTGGDISHVGFWLLVVLVVAVGLGAFGGLVHVLIGPWFDVKDARYVAQQRRERARKIVLASSDRRSR